MRCASVPAFPPLVMLCGLLSCIILIGALVASAEAGRMIARYLGLAAVLLASTSLVGGFVAMERMAAASSEERDE
ncbi:proton-translocating transhydrogenase family protein [Sphingobium sp. AN558]|uniref:proton-translocating transhydrogenase family protein n=1 Tax=Sphingobium sp. AN558 TaxID=3133442 RepID=UPI0030BD553B